MNDEPDLTGKVRKGFQNEVKLAVDRERSRKEAEKKDEDWKAPKLDEEDRWKKTEQSRSWLMFVFSAVVIAGAALAIWQYFSVPVNPPLRENKVNESGSLAFLEKSSAAEVDEEIERIMTGFLRAENHAERCKFIRGGVSNLSLLKEYYERPDRVVPTGFEKINFSEPVALSGTPIYLVSVLQDDIESAYLLVPHQEGLAIDWKATVAWGEVSWEEFLRRRSEAPLEMRVYLRRSAVPVDSAVESDFYFVEISSREGGEAITGGFRKGSPVASKLRKIIPQNASQPVTVFLCWDDEISLFKISEVKYNFWLAPVD